ncbi:MAG TPA: rRNA maturation RNase YbeY [Anaerolineae bacterium]|nr:rRNA maturation RNase YbeY [Anaerolineae bacterium]
MGDKDRIDVQTAPRFAGEVDEELLRRVTAEVLRREGVEGEVTLSVVITDDEAVRELNRQFRDVDAPTDVLAFGGGREGDFVTAPGEPAYLGDVVISYPRAVAQAEEYGHSIDRELALLAVHGVLHLLGYDHVDEAERTEMWARQDEILRDLAL